MVSNRAAERHVPTGGIGLFAEIGGFLTRHRLSPTPAHYAFAHEVLSNRRGSLASRVSELTDGGFRLSENDIAELAGIVAAVSGQPMDLPGEAANDAAASEPDAGQPSETERVIERAMMQIDGFGDTVQAVCAETSDFGRDLERSAETIRSAGGSGVDEVVLLITAMLGRVRQTEQRLAVARRESDELREALDEARGSARTDALTELPNRRAYDERFSHLSPDAAVTVAICDIDLFKRVNDSFGHGVGDRVLVEVARTLENECGADSGHGFVARYGGEEFALLFRDTTPEQAMALIERAREKVMARRTRVRETSEAIGIVSFSAGVATGQQGDGRAALMARADAALYRAKALGRARTEIAP